MKGLVHGFLPKDLDGAEQLYRRALSTNPNEPLAWLYLGTLCGWRSKGDEAWAAASRGLSLSPVDPLHYYFDTQAAFAALAADRLEDAERLARRSLRAHRLHTATHRTLAIVQWLRGDVTGARETVADMLRIEPGFAVQRYRARFPGGESPMLNRFAEVLSAAGAPD
jgi:adenylate cyclase